VVATWRPHQRPLRRAMPHGNDFHLALGVVAEDMVPPKYDVAIVAYDMAIMSYDVAIVALWQMWHMTWQLKHRGNCGI
jgi:hypothetical protein